MANCLVKWKPKCLCVCVWDGRDGSCEERKREEGREKALLEREREAMSLKHLKKHFPLSYHLDVVSGTKSTNTHPPPDWPDF